MFKRINIIIKMIINTAGFFTFVYSDVIICPTQQYLLGCCVHIGRNLANKFPILGANLSSNLHTDTRL